MNQLQAMRVFARVVDLASFNLAARQLGISAAAATRSVGMLEAHLNTRLLNRTTRTLSLTEAGRAYLIGCRAILEQLDEMDANLVQSTRELRGTLRVASVATFAQTGLAQLLAAYRALYEGVSLNVTTFDVNIDMVEGGFDVCFSDDPKLLSSTLVCRPLFHVPSVLVASPEYLSAHDRPHSPSSLGRHTLLCRAESSARYLEFVDRNGAHRVTVAAALVSSSDAMLKAAALRDMGIASLPRQMVEPEIQRGELVQVLEQFDVSTGDRRLSLLYSSPAQLSLKVRSFVDFAVSQYRTSGQAATLRAVA